MEPNLSESRPLCVLLVEDDEDDVLLTRDGFESAKLTVDLHHVWDGVECMQFLRKQGAHVGAPTPDLILLDLNMPKMDGREVLRELVHDPGLRDLPVVVLTTSAETRDIEEMYALRCSSYVQKPVNLERFVEVIRLFRDYWLTAVVLPRKAGD